MRGRNYNSDKANYGYNGKRKDIDIYAEGNAYDFGDRIYSPRLGRWLAIDMLARRSPGETPFRFGHNNPMRFKDPDGSWEEDGHFWTVYAMGVAKGLSKARAYEIAVKAEYYDHYVHKDANGNISMSIHPSASGIAWGKDGGLGTWADPSKQTEWHALTGGLQKHVNSVAKRNVLVDGDLNQLHTVGDSWSHSYVDDNGVRKMWGKNFSILGKEFNYTVEHAFGGGHGNENADNISKRPQEYGAYVNDLNNIMNSDLFAFKSEVKNFDPDRTVFNYVQQNGGSKENNVFLFQSYIGVMTGEKSFTPQNATQANLLQGLFTQMKLGSTMTTTTTTTTTYTDKSKKKIKSQTQTQTFNVKVNQ